LKPAGPDVQIVCIVMHIPYLQHDTRLDTSFQPIPNNVVCASSNASMSRDASFMTRASAPGDVPTQGDCIDSPCLPSSVSVSKEMRDGEDAGDAAKPSSGAMCPMQVQVLKLDEALFAQESGTMRTSLNVKAAAFVPRMVYDQMDSSADQRTTVTMRNLPTIFSCAELVDLVNSKGFQEQFEFQARSSRWTFL
ncbi:unnamed protein product, partial [Prorocentrum cordatum]